MKNAFLKRQSLGKNLPADGSGRYYDAKNAEEKFHAARVTAFGCGCCRPYAKAWHPEYGLLTDEDDQLILRLNDDEDRASFCRDFLDQPEKVLFPQGIGANLFPVTKTVSISGALTMNLWTGKLAGNILASGHTPFVLPHVR